MHIISNMYMCVCMCVYLCDPVLFRWLFYTQHGHTITQCLVGGHVLNTGTIDLDSTQLTPQNSKTSSWLVAS